LLIFHSPPARRATHVGGAEAEVPERSEVPK
jgi:hypothetical protein